MRFSLEKIIVMPIWSKRITLMLLQKNRLLYYAVIDFKPAYGMTQAKELNFNIKNA